MTAILAILRRELRLAARCRSEWLLPPFFFVVVVALFGLGTRPNDPQLAAFAPAILWMAALLSALLGLDRLFRSDFEDGSLEQLCLSSTPLSFAILIKLIAHWLTSGLPLALMAAPAASVLGLQQGAGTLVAGLLLGTPCLSLIGGFVAALTVGLPRAGALLPVLVLPLLVPVLVFGSGAVRAAQAGLDAGAPLYFLGAILVLCLTLIPWAAAAALRNAFD